MRALVCGSRDWDDPAPISAVLGGLLDQSIVNFEDLVVIEGCARGADSVACHYWDGPCEAPGGGTHGAHDYVEHRHFPADWNKHGRAAGPIRNAQMLSEGKPDLVIAFTEQPPSRGTGDMIARAKAAGVPVWVVSHG